MISTEQKNKIRSEFEKRWKIISEPICDEYDDIEDDMIMLKEEIADFFLSKFDELQAEERELQQGIGVSKWKNYGEKYGYDTFWEKKAREEGYKEGLHETAIKLDKEMIEFLKDNNQSGERII